MNWRRSVQMLVVLGFVGAVGAGCSSSPPPLPPGQDPPIGSAPTGDDAAGTPAVAPTDVAESVASYRLGAGDLVRMTVFRHEDLSGEFQLDGEGYFAIPLVGEILAGGLTSRQLESEIEVRLKSGDFLVSPQVSVEVLNYRPFYIIGEVRNPGSYQYVNGMTVMNAIALAGGFTYRADTDDIMINRGGSNGPEMLAEPDSEVLPGDILNVTERFF